MVDDDVVDASLGDGFNLPDDEWFPRDIEQGFGLRVGEWAHPLAASCGKNHSDLNHGVFSCVGRLNG